MALKRSGEEDTLSCPKCGSEIDRGMSKAREKEGEIYCCAECAEDRGCACAQEAALAAQTVRRPTARRRGRSN